MKPLPIIHPDSSKPCSSVEWNRSWGIVMVILVVLAVYLIGYNPAPVESKMDFATFPIYIGEWVGEEADLQEALVRVKGSDYELIRKYQNPEGQSIELYVAYLETQLQGKEIVDYRTSSLHFNAEKVRIQLSPERSLSINRTHYGETRNSRSILFWYDINNRVISNRYLAKLATMLDGLLYGRTNGALVLIAFDGDGGEVQKFEADFVQNLFPVLRLYLP